MAEIARAGILSVDKGQAEAAQALGMRRGKTMRRVVLPQAMRVIVPPTGNETIAMVKDTSLLIGDPVTSSCSTRLPVRRSAASRSCPASSRRRSGTSSSARILMVGQSYLERYFGRGFGSRCRRRPSRSSTEIGADH